MNVYLAGISAGNIYHIWRDHAKNPEEAMNIFLSAPHSNEIRSGMNIYIAGIHGEDTRGNMEGDFKQKVFVLESFVYVKDWMDPYIKNYWNFMLDSGAFTYMNGKDTSEINWNNYVDNYADYINEKGIDLFMELDIDNVLTYLFHHHQ